MKAMILAAGHGTRMQSITQHTPKPLVTIRKKPLIAYHIEKLAACGIRDIVINVSYLKEKFVDALGDGQQFGVNIHFSFEDQKLETGGGILNALPLLGDTPFIVVSGDVWTDFNFATLFNQTAPHLVLVPNPSHHPNGDFGLKNGNVSTSSEPKYTYGNISVLHPQLFEGFSESIFPLRDVLVKAIDAGLATGELFEGVWTNVDTPERLELVRTN